jgi:hypothetical protein
MTERHLQIVESRPRTPAEIVAERLQVLEEFVEKYGLDWWDHHDTAPDQAQLQLDLESEAA